MFKKLSKKSGFTLIELVMVIIILGILAVVAIPRYINLKEQAEEAAEQGVVGGVRAGISIAHAAYLTDRTADFPDVADWSTGYPDVLDDAGNNTQASNINPFFDHVLQQGGITDWRWSKDGDGDYVGPDDGEYRYDNTDGSFLMITP